MLQQIGFAGKTGTVWEKLYKISIGGVIITVLGFVPGYWVTVFTIEKIGRKPIQIGGFLLEALVRALLFLWKCGRRVLRSWALRSRYLGWQVQLAQPRLLHRPLRPPPILLQLRRQHHDLCAYISLRSSMIFLIYTLTDAQIYPAEVFPTRFKAFAHGMSAAAGKGGAIISALVFNTLSQHKGTPTVLWIFVACCLAGAGALTLIVIALCVLLTFLRFRLKQSSPSSFPRLRAVTPMRSTSRSSGSAVNERDLLQNYNRPYHVLMNATSPYSSSGLSTMSLLRCRTNTLVKVTYSHPG